MTLANSLALPRDELAQYIFYSKTPFASGYVGGYTSRSYMYSMLHLMGYSYDSREIDMDDLIAQLHEEGRIGEIPKELILSAANNIARRKTGKNIGTKEIERINDSFERRNEIFTSNLPQIELNLLNNEIAVVKTYKTNMPEHEYVDIASIDVGPQYFEEIERLRTGEPGRRRPQEEPINPNPVEPVNPTPVEPINPNPVEPVSSTPIEPVNQQQEEPQLFQEEDFSEGYIAGTTIRRPRAKRVDETEEDYMAFLNRDYDYYFPNEVVRGDILYQPTAERIFTEEHL